MLLVASLFRMIPTITICLLKEILSDVVILERSDKNEK